MELCGEELSQRIKKRTYYSEKDGRKLTRQMLQAIKTMHDKGIIHRWGQAFFVESFFHSVTFFCLVSFRNIKPESFRFRSDENDVDIKLGHFTHVIEPAKGPPTQACGSSSCFSPEMIRGEEYGICGPSEWFCLIFSVEHLLFSIKIRQLYFK
jgi:serine/threonine protein kinase